MKVLIIKPNSKEKQYQTLKELTAKEPPLWALLFANKFKDVEILDSEAKDLNLEETIKKVEETNPDKVYIFATGSHPSAHIQQSTISFKLKKKIKRFKPEVIDRLGENPINQGRPNWNLLDLNKYRCHNWHAFGGRKRSPYGAIYTSLSCPFKCKFCTIKDFYGQVYKERPIEDIIRDFDDLGKRGIKNIKMMDEIFIFKKDRVKKICNEISKLNYDFNIWTYGRIDIMDKDILKHLKKAGFNWLAYGIESGNEKIRTKVQKGKFTNQNIKNIINITKKEGINVIGNYIFGFWEDSLKTMKETLDLAKNLNCEYSNFYCLVAYPGSKLYIDSINKGIKLPHSLEDYAQMSKNFKPLPTKYLSGKEVLKFRDNAFNEYFNSSRYLNMIKERFGEEGLKDIKKMTSINIKRNNEN